jgi:hypothetical protein
MDLTVQGIITTSGKLLIYERGEMEHFLNANKDKRVVVSIKDVGTKVDTNYFRFYHGYVIPKFRAKLKETGHLISDEAVDQFVARNCSSRKESIQQNQKIVDIIVPLSDMTRSQWNDFMIEIGVLAGEMGFNIDGPL